MINFDKFCTFVRHQLETGDYDAHIPWMVGLMKKFELRLDEAVEIGFLYMAYYNEASAWQHWAWHKMLRPDELKKTLRQLPIESQRRNLYGGRIEEHLCELHEMNLEKPWLERLQSCGSWEDLLDEIESVYGNGRWASYTTSELMLHLAKLDLEPDSFEILTSSGPLNGLLALGLQPCEETAKEVHEALGAEGISTTYSQLESLLCDWCGVCTKGSFYSGRNIDRQQARIIKVERMTGASLPELWEIRKEVYPHKSLGELNGWVGIDKERLKHYKRSGEVLAPWEGR